MVVLFVLSRPFDSFQQSRSSPHSLMAAINVAPAAAPAAAPGAAEQHFSPTCARSFFTAAVASQSRGAARSAARVFFSQLLAPSGA